MLLLLFLWVPVAFPLVTGIHIEPIRSSWSSWTQSEFPNHYVSQVLTMNFDELDSTSGAYCELFAGSRCNGGQYTLTVLTYPGGSQIADVATANGNVDHKWVRFKLHLTRPDSIVKGKKLEFQFSRIASTFGDSLEFYYDSAAGYSRYGQMIAPSLPSLPSTAGLAMRCYGRMNPVDSLAWGASSWWFPSSLPGRHTWADCMSRLGATWSTCEVAWPACEPLPGLFDFDSVDHCIRYIAESAGMRPVGVLVGTPKWASTRIDTTPIIASPGFRVDTSRFAPPRGLFGNDTALNHWARYLDTLLDHVDLFDSALRIHTWSVWNESNEGATTWVYGDSYPGYTGWWRRPNRYYDVDTTWRSRCSLYVRLCVVAESVITSHSGHTDDRIIIGELGRINHPDPSVLLVPGKEWLRTFYDIADRPWNHYAVSAHPYQTSPVLFDPDTFEADVETLRTVMRQHNDTAQLWNSEFNFGIRDWISGEDNANSLAEAYISMFAHAGSPGGTYDRGCWWPSWAPEGHGAWSLVHGEECDTDPNFFAFQQTAEQFVGKRFNGRVMTEDAGDAHIRMYEFEDPDSLKKTWVCWSTLEEQDGGVVAGLPVRSDTAYTESLAYNNTPPSDDAAADATGWLWPALTSRPVFITEPDERAISRPELVAESLWLSPIWSGLPLIDTVHVRIKNRDLERSTPVGCVTWVRFTWNDSILDSICRTDTIGAGETVVESFAWELPEWFHGDGLLAAKVNPGMAFVEREGTDDNQAYVRLVFRGAIGGTLDVTGPPGGKTDAPLLVCGLSRALRAFVWVV